MENPVVDAFDVFSRDGEKIGRVEILADGLIKQTFDGVSDANHATADAFVKMIASMGEKTEVERKQGHGHAHAHGHTHNKAGQ